MSNINQNILTVISKININIKAVLKFLLIIFLSFGVSIIAAYMTEETERGISRAWSSVFRMSMGFSKFLLLLFGFVWILDLWFNKKKQKK